ncbi:MAG: ribosome recycling factor [Candidatus Izemoplasmatales bacterium]|jgi:ribosome recycling factor|nr:ribosome recycling factor [Candidatus Izemoplasmatales bacterium]MDD4595154.1 ribosome recycling factor [Candidatus Izemoplasmatales bacterium]
MPEMILMEAEEKMELSLEALRREFVTIRTGRANPKMLERVTVDYYGAQSPINQIASVQVPEANQIYVKPYDKSVLSKIEKAILAANLGLTPTNDGNGLRMIFPAMTEERRKESVKVLHKLAEENKVAIRNVRRDAIADLKKMEKDKLMTEDQLEIYQDEVQKLTDKFIEKIDHVTFEKEKDVMHI